MIVTSEYFSGASVATVWTVDVLPRGWKWPGLLSSARPGHSGSTTMYTRFEQSQLLYVHALVLCEAPVKPPGVSFVRWAKRDALPLAVAQLELIPHVVFVRTFTHVAAAFLPNALWTCLRRLQAAISGFSADLTTACEVVAVLTALRPVR